MLRKVASLTYDLAMEHKQVGSPKMRTLPERQDLSCLENFEGILYLKYICLLKRINHISRFRSNASLEFIVFY